LFPEAKSLQTSACLLFQQNQHQKISEKLNAISALRVRFNPLVRYNEGTEEVLRQVGDTEHDSSNFLSSQKILVQWNEKIDGIHLFTLCLHGQ